MDSSLMEAGELSRCIGARLVSFSGNTHFSSVAIDSRNVKKGSLFFALNGKSTDGHLFIKDAFKAGAAGAVAQASKLDSLNLVNIAKEAGGDLIIVEDTLAGLQDSARVYLEKFPKLQKVGITGSSGKTTTKEIAYSIICAEKNTVRNIGNLNSETGLPLSVFEVSEENEVCIFELGMNKRNEILNLANVLKPNIALVTNIGTAHIEFFGSKLEILKEKKAIFNFMTDKDVALISEDEELKNELSSGLKGKIKYFGIKAFGELENARSLGLDGTEITWAGEKIRLRLPGKHSLADALGAIAIAKEIPVSGRAIKKGLESADSLFGRLEILRGKTTVVRDCYNSNPDSLEKSVNFCDSIDWPARKIYCIGEMLELGSFSAAAHESAGRLLSSSKADMVFLFGKETENCAASLEKNSKKFFHSNSFNELSGALERFIKKGDLVLLKGSRGCALERLTETLLGSSIPKPASAGGEAAG